MAATKMPGPRHERLAPCSPKGFEQPAAVLLLNQSIRKIRGTFRYALDGGTEIMS